MAWEINRSWRLDLAREKEGEGGRRREQGNLRTVRRRSRGVNEMKLDALSGVSSAFHRLGTRAVRVSSG